MPEKTDSLEKHAENVTAEFVSSLGLIDIILGSLFLYGHYAAVPLSITRLPSSGYAVLDVGLLLCAAALVGKIISLGIALVMAGVESRVERWMFHDELLHALVAARPTMASSDAKRRPLASAVALVRATDPPTDKLLKQLENQAILSYGAGLLSLLFGTGYKGVTSGLVPASLLIVFAVLFFALGVVQQVDYFIQAIEFLKTVDKNESKIMNETIWFHIDTTEEPNASDAARLLLGLNALHVAVMLTDSERGAELNSALTALDLPAIDSLSPNIGDDKIFGALAAINSVAPQKIAGALEFQRLHRGTLSGAVREIFQRVFGSLKKLAANLPSLLPGQDGKAFEAAVTEIASSAPAASQFRGTAMTAAANIKTALQNMQATKLATK